MTVPTQAALPAPRAQGLERRRPDPLWRAIALLELSPATIALSVLLGVLALGSAVALAAVSAWLIARASQMPPVLQLSVATVAVRAFGIGRGVFRYAERITSHDLALRGMAQLRETLYTRLAAGRDVLTFSSAASNSANRLGVGDVIGTVMSDPTLKTKLGCPSASHART